MLTLIVKKARQAHARRRGQEGAGGHKHSDTGRHVPLITEEGSERREGPSPNTVLYSVGGAGPRRGKGAFCHPPCRVGHLLRKPSPKKWKKMIVKEKKERKEI